MTEFLVRRLIRDAQNTEDPSVREAYGRLAGIVGGKFLLGTLTGSVAITADAVNNLSDASSSIVTLIGFRLAAKPADEGHPFGHHRIEYLAGLAVGYWESVGEIRKQWQAEHIFEPAADRTQIAKAVAGWEDAVRRVLREKND